MRRNCLLLGTLLAIALVTAYHHRRAWHPSGFLCDPYAQPGSLEWAGNNTNAVWKQHYPTAACPDPEDWLERFRVARLALPEEMSTEDAETRELRRRQRDALEQTAWAANTTFALLGDSVDRNALRHFATLTGSAYWASDYADPRLSGVPAGWDERGVPHHSHIERTDTRIVNCFLYGVGDRDQDFAHAHDAHPPFRAEDRIEQLCGTFTHQLDRPVGLVSLHSGLWDLALFGRQDGVAAGSTPLSTEQMTFWLERMDVVVAAVRRTWPGVPIWIRTSHRVGDRPDVSADYALPGKEAVANFFPDQRSAQMRTLQLALAKKHCLPVNDFAAVWEGHQMSQDKVHPLLHPGGAAYNNMLLHHAWMESQGRHTWAVQPC